MAQFIADISLIILIVSGLAPGAIQKVEVVEGSITVSTGLAYTVQTIVAVGLLLVSVAIFLWGYRKFDKSQKAATNYLLTGILIALVSNFVTGFILSENAGVQFLGPLSILIMTALVAYAITKHKLFDIRLIVARALGYALTLLTVAGAYSLFVFVVLAGFLGTDKISPLQRTTYSVLAVLFGFSLPPLKQFFDKLTNKLFYKDAYDAQNFLDTFNKTLVGNIDLQPLLREASELIEVTLKAEYCLFGIRETENSARRIIGTKSIHFTDEDIAETMAHTPKVHQKVIVVDELEEHNSKLKLVLARNNVAILARLISSVNQKQGQGYLILGQKKER